ncbi:MAG: hypothetical protein AAGK04_13005, partial [Planctomycetota bacterium]
MPLPPEFADRRPPQGERRPRLIFATPLVSLGRAEHGPDAPGWREARDTGIPPSIGFARVPFVY